MCAEIVSIGFELRLGQIVDANVAFIARHLAAIGLDRFQKRRESDEGRKGRRGDSGTLSLQPEAGPASRGAPVVPLAKPVGTALCFIVEQGERSVISSPGVP
jgi:molybdopterin-biosynthesis enzyme MoeA-like protein